MRSQFWGCPNGQFLLGVQQEIQMGKGCSYKDLLGTTLQSNPVLGDPPRIPSSSPSVFLSLIPPLSSATSGSLFPFTPLNSPGCYGNSGTAKEAEFGKVLVCLAQPTLLSCPFVQVLGDFYCSLKKWTVRAGCANRGHPSQGILHPHGYQVLPTYPLYSTAQGLLLFYPLIALENFH
jgi:hypothetical protein